MSFNEILKSQLLIVDGATGTMIQNLNLTASDYGGESFEMLADLLNFSRPDDLRGIHLEYLKAGANIIETNTFGSCPLRLSEFDFQSIDTSSFKGLQDDLKIQFLSPESLAYHLNVAGCRVANQALREYQGSADYDGRSLFIAGSVGPSNYVLSNTTASLKRGTWEKIEENFYHQVCGLIDGGADIILFETQQDVLELKAGVAGAKKAMTEKNRKLPIMAQVTVDQFARMQIFHTDIHAALTTIQGIGVDTFGINCSIGPDLMVPAIEKLSRYSHLPVSVLPNAGMPVSENGNTVYRLSPDELAEHLYRFVTEFGVNIVGGCCGTTPEHIRVVADKLKGVSPASRIPDSSIWISGPQNAVAVDSSSGFIRIGERLNVRGSKKVRQAVENEQGVIDFDTLEEVVREQLEVSGSSVIDVCMDSNVVDTESVLSEVVRVMTTDFKGAMCLDSFDSDALSQAVKSYPGRPMINSISLEEVSPGVTKAEALVSATCFHNPIYIALAADDSGPATTTEQKVMIADSMVELCNNYNVVPDQILVDINAFPIGSEPDGETNFALESLKAIPKIKGNHPGIKTTIGVSNLTSGLASKPYMRRVLTSVFLDEGRKRGLDAAIVNPNHYAPVESLDPHDYALGLRVVMDKDMDAFAELETIAEGKAGMQIRKKKSYDTLSPADAVREKIIDGVKDRVSGSIETGNSVYTYADRIVETVAIAIETIEPLTLINDYLMAAMKHLGDRFSAGEVSLPHLLKSADIMKQVMGFLEHVIAESSGTETPETKGTIVLGTVYQDVHSIGKDLGKTLLENYGYRVIDLGVQVQPERFVEAAIKENADAIGMSALLVQTSGHMVTVASMMADSGVDIPILIGGAPVSFRHAASVATRGSGSPETIKPDVFYCSSAMDAVTIMEALKSQNRETMISENRKTLLRHYHRTNSKPVLHPDGKDRMNVNQGTFGNFDFQKHDSARKLVSYPISKMALNTGLLYGLNWNMGPEASWEKKGYTRERMNALKSHWISTSEQKGWVEPSGIIRLFPCRSDGNDVILYDPENTDHELGRLTFSAYVRKGTNRECHPASFFRSLNDDELDIIGLQICTGGPNAGEAVRGLTESDDLESAFMVQGLANRAAEDMAEILHNKLRERAGVKPTAGARFSPGYPGLSDSRNNRVIADLLNAQSIGITVTDAGGFYPTGTTAAAVCFHSEAGY